MLSRGKQCFALYRISCVEMSTWDLEIIDLLLVYSSEFEAPGYSSITIRIQSQLLSPVHRIRISSSPPLTPAASLEFNFSLQNFPIDFLSQWNHLTILLLIKEQEIFPHLRRIKPIFNEH
jgi:hypothetical protein